jgi:hypothetical protein
MQTTKWEAAACRGTLAVQAFNKADTIIASLDSLAGYQGSQNYDLVILQDRCLGSKRADEYCAAQRDTIRAIEA